MAAEPAVKAAPDRSLPIVGIGASAGGLEALEQFFAHVPPKTGMAFVIVQHLDPTHECIMPELLQRSTAMKVVQVVDRTTVRPDSVYVIPPNKDMSILHGVLHLLEPVAPRGLRLPIDFFFRSLAADERDHSIGIILSGMGSDGTLGLRAIKGKAGVVLVQDPASAKFNGMPRSAIEAGVADIVGRAEELPGKLISFLQHAPIAPESGVKLEEKAQSALEKIAILLRAHTGHDFSRYKKNTVHRRVERRMGLHQIPKLATYVRYLQENPQELDLLFKELLIGVTSFFRDPAAWEHLVTTALPSLLGRSPDRKAFRAWVAGCSSGEEAYSLAMAFKEVVEKIAPRKDLTLQVFATDLDRDAIDRARQGCFPFNIAADVSAERLERFFVKEDDGYRVTKEIREMVIFAQQNLIMDPPFTKLDLLCCRNLLIYLEPEPQKSLIPLFHYSLRAGGLLFLGSAEAIGTFGHLFKALDGKSRIFCRTMPVAGLENVDFPSSFLPGRVVAPEELPVPKPGASFQAIAEQLLLQRYSPAAVLANDRGDILFISGRTGRYLEPAAGRANLNLFAMAREGLRYEIVGAFQKAVRHKEEVRLPGLQVSTEGGTQWVDVSLQRLEEPEALRGTVLVVFAEVTAPLVSAAAEDEPTVSTRAGRARDYERKLKDAREELQATREQMQTTQEELRSMIEELQSTNEEMQSTNEELTTSKEEMQSLNEELQTVNTELQVKVDELSRSNNDMQNLLNSTDIATVFLDNDLNVRRFTTQATKIIKLIPGDVGRPVTDLASALLYPALVEDVQEVLRTLAFIEKRIVARDSRWFAVRIMPYRTLDNRIDGVVITFSDITSHRPAGNPEPAPGPAKERTKTKGTTP
ncbi:MAG: chemotaxis protein CheB [Candidatus Didemnitutus sp.]|nr:chemotaxis protein CheB [Candidatus Didemnitutus sp.]